MITIFRREWQACTIVAILLAVEIIEPAWAFEAVRLVSACIYAVLLAASS